MGEQVDDGDGGIGDCANHRRAISSLEVGLDDLVVLAVPKKVKTVLIQVVLGM